MKLAVSGKGGVGKTTLTANIAAALANIGPGLGPEIGPAGNYAGQVSFANNDSDENPYNFSIQGTGAMPLDFGDAPDTLPDPPGVGTVDAPAYPTLFADDGARHEIVPGFHLGLQVQQGRPHDVRSRAGIGPGQGVQPVLLRNGHQVVVRGVVFDLVDPVAIAIVGVQPRGIPVGLAAPFDALL